VRSLGEGDEKLHRSFGPEVSEPEVSVRKFRSGSFGTGSFGQFRASFRKADKKAAPHAVPAAERCATRRRPSGTAAKGKAKAAGTARSHQTASRRRRGWAQHLTAIRVGTCIHIRTGSQARERSHERSVTGGG
jgi:hypothetical protein